MTDKILVTGAVGQIGSELVPELRKKYGNDNVIATGHRTQPSDELKNGGPFEFIDATDKEALTNLIQKHNITIIYHLVGVLSAVGEKNPDLAWRVNMDSLKHVLDLAKEHNLRVFWPSSIAAFGPDTPKENTPNETILRPTTMYGITKVAGELMCEYYVNKFNLDVRSLRYPGIISHKTLPGGGTTDYAVAIFYDSIKNNSYQCFVRADTVLPMMYMPDCIKATIDLMDANQDNLKHRVFNITAMSFSAQEIADEIKKHLPDFEINYQPDFRQKIADSWPKSIDDSAARTEWNWQPDFNLQNMTEDMLKEIKKK